jgi:hypothetical protein
MKIENSAPFLCAHTHPEWVLQPGSSMRLTAIAQHAMPS